MRNDKCALRNAESGPRTASPGVPRKAATRPAPLVCVLCDAPATVFCQDCRQPFCAPCATEYHLPRKYREHCHIEGPAGATSTSTSPGVGVCTVGALDWGGEQKCGSAYSVVLLADLVHRGAALVEKDGSHTFRHLIGMLLQTTDDASLVLLAYKKRFDPCEAGFWSQVQRYFAVHRQTHGSSLADGQFADVTLFTMKRKVPKLQAFLAATQSSQETAFRSKLVANRLLGAKDAI